MWRNQFCCFVSVPNASSSESESIPNILSAEQRRALEQAAHGSGPIVANTLHKTFATSASSGDSPTAGANNSNESSAAAPCAMLLLEPDHAVSGMDGVRKAAAADAAANPASASKMAALKLASVGSEEAKLGSSSTQIKMDGTKKRTATEESSGSDVAEGSAKKQKADDATK